MYGVPALGVVAAAAGVVWLASPAGNTWILARLLEAVAPPEGAIEVDGLRTDLFWGAALEGVRLRDAAGRVLLEAEHVELAWDLSELPNRRLRVTTLDIRGVRVDARVDAAGSIDLVSIWGPASGSGGPYEGLPIDLALDTLRIDVDRARVDGGAWVGRVEEAQIVGALDLVGDAVIVRTLRMSGSVAEPALGALQIAGAGRWDPDTTWVDALTVAVGAHDVTVSGGIRDGTSAAPTVALRVDSATIDLERLPLVEEPLPVRGSVRAQGTVTGTLLAPSVHLDLDTAGGRVTVEGSLDRSTDPVRWSAEVRTDGLDVARVAPDVPATRVVGGATMTGEGLEWPAGVRGVGEVDLVADGLGQGVRVTVVGGLAVDDGQIQARGLRVDTDGARVRLDGDVRVAEGRVALRVGSFEVDLATLGRFGVPAMTGRVAFEGVVDGAWTEGVRATAAGRIRALTPLRAPGVGAVASVTGDVTAGLTPEGVRASLAVALAGAEGPGVLSDSASALVDLRLASAGDAGSVRGTADLVGVRAAADPTVRVARADAAFDLAWSPGGIDGTATATHGAVGARGWSADSGVLAVGFDGARVTLTADSVRGGAPALVVRAEADTRARTARVSELLFAPGEGPAWRTDGAASARWFDDGVADARLVLRAGEARLGVSGDARLDGDVALSFDVGALDLGALAVLDSAAFAGFGGTIDAEGTLSGRASAPLLAMELRGRGLAAPGLRRAGLDFRAASAPDGQSVAVTGRVGSGDATLATIDARLPIALDPRALAVRRGDPLRLVATIAPTELTDWNTLLTDQKLPPARVSAELRVEGTVDAPEVWTVVSADVPVDGRHVGLEIDVRPDGDAVAVYAVAREQRLRRGEVRGTLDLGLRELLRTGAMPEGGPLALVRGMVLDVVPLQLPVATLVALARVPVAARGDLLGGIRLTGTPARPRVEGALLVIGGAVGSARVEPAQVVIGSGSAGFTVDADVGFPTEEGGPARMLDVRGFIPFDVSTADPLAARGLALAIDGDGLPLEIAGALTTLVTDASGTASIHGRVLGSVKEPLPELQAQVRDAAFTVPLSGIRYEIPRLDAHLGEDRLTVPEFEIVTARADAPRERGRIEASLSLGRDGFTPTDAKGTVRLDRAFLLGLPAQLVQVDGAVALSGAWPKLRVDGDVRVREGALILDETFFTSASSPLALPPEIQVVRQDVPNRTAVAASGFAIPEWVDVRLEVDIARAGFLEAAMPMRENLGDVASDLTSVKVSSQADGKVRASVREGEIGLVGEVRPIRGTATVFLRAFDIREGTLTFTGRDYTDPVLDLTAVWDSNGYGNIEVRITGSATAPQIAFTNDEEAWGSTDEILAILVTGRPMGENSAGLKPEDQLLAAALTVLSGEISEARTAVDLDVLEVGSEGLRIGRRVGPNLFLLVEWNPAGDDVEEARVDVTLQWQLAERWSAEANGDSLGEGILSFRWKRRF